MNEADDEFLDAFDKREPLRILFIRAEHHVDNISNLDESVKIQP